MRLPLFAAAVLLTLAAPAFAGPVAAGRFAPDPKLPTELGVPYVVITNEELAPSFQRLVEWKRSTGLPAQIVTTEWLQKSAYYPGVDLPERLYRLLQDLRLNWKTRWIVLGGNVEVVPQQRVRAYRGDMGGDRISSDVYYSDVLPEDRTDADKIASYGWNSNGDRFIGDYRDDAFDLVPELYVGRIPVGTPKEAEAFFDKYFEYVNPQGKDLAWLGRALVVGAHQFEDQQTTLAALFRELGGSGYTVATVFEKKPQPIQAITDELNQGYAFWDFFCHGCPAHFWACDDHTSWGVVQSQTLKNAGRYPIVFANSCDTAEFEHDDCLAETMVRQPKSGAIAYVGYSSLSFQSEVNRAMYKLLFGGGCPQLGRAMAEAKRVVAQDVWVGEVLNLFGEPELWVRTAVPVALKTTGERFAQNVPARVTVADAQDRPVRGARVLLEAAGVYAAGETDATGLALLPPPGKAGAARLSVLAQNGFRLEKKVNIDGKPPEGTAAIPRPTLAVDDSAGEGNGQKDLNPGESVRFVFTWPKETTLPSGTLTFACDDDPFVKCPSPTQAVAGKTDAAFPVMADARVPSWHQAWVRLTFTPEPPGDPWTWTFRQPVEGPSVACVAVAVDDAEGNKDKRIGWEDAGKKIRFGVGLYNSGTQKANGLQVKAACADPAVTLGKDTIAFGALPCEEPVLPKDKAFEFTLAADYDGHPLEFTLAIEDDRKNRWSGKLLFTIPPAPPILVRAEGGLRTMAVSWTPGGSPGVVGYHVYRGTSEKGPFARITEQPVKGGTRFPDAAVKPMTAYVYVVTCVTADGLESRYSGPARGHTLSPLPKTAAEGGKK